MATRYRNPQAQWLGSPNFSPNRDGHNLDEDPRYIVMHTMVGTWQSANARFQNAAQKASAHYGVCLDGSLKQWVNEGDASWAAGNYQVNLDAINIEHEDGGDYNGPRTPALYARATTLLADICQRTGIPCDRAHVRLHKEVSDTPTACPDALDVNRILTGAQTLLGGTPDMDPKDFEALIWRVHCILYNLDAVQDGPTKGEKNLLKVAIEATKASGSLPPKFDATITPK